MAGIADFRMPIADLTAEQFAAGFFNRKSTISNRQ
jgi:hypothetical protein